MLRCPNCASDRLEIRQRSGLERLMMYFTPRRKYRCLICRYKFRAMDRRRWSREESDQLAAARKAGFHR